MSVDRPPSRGAWRSRSLELRDLDIMIKVVEVGSFRGAAAEFRVEPSAVSRRIRSLEDRLGASLFERSRSGVRLTDAGRLFHDGTRTAIEHLDHAVRSVLVAGRGGSGNVTIGITGSLSSCFLGQLIRTFRAEHPSVVMTISEGSHHDHLAGIADHSLDIAFVLGCSKPEGFDAEHLWSEPVLAALASDDQRTVQPRLSFSSLAHDHFITSSDPSGLEVHDFIIRSLSGVNFRPNISRYRIGREAVIKMVGLDFGTSLACGAEIHVSYPHVTFVPLVGEEVPFSAIWSPQNDNPALRRLVSLARRLRGSVGRTDAVEQTPDPSP